MIYNFSRCVFRKKSWTIWYEKCICGTMDHNFWNYSCPGKFQCIAVYWHCCMHQLSITISTPKGPHWDLQKAQVALTCATLAHTAPYPAFIRLLLGFTKSQACAICGNWFLLSVMIYITIYSPLQSIWGGLVAISVCCQSNPAPFLTYSFFYIWMTVEVSDKIKV